MTTMINSKSFVSVGEFDRVVLDEMLRTPREETLWAIEAAGRVSLYPEAFGIDTYACMICTTDIWNVVDEQIDLAEAALDFDPTDKDARLRLNGWTVIANVLRKM